MRWTGLCVGTLALTGCAGVPLSHDVAGAARPCSEPSSLAAQRAEPGSKPSASEPGRADRTPSAPGGPQAPRARFVLDTAITGATGATWLGLRLALPRLGRESCPCDRNEVNALDRPAVDWELPMGAELSNIAAALVILVPAWALWHSASDWTTFGNDMLLVLEATMVSGLITQIVKTSVGRPYPYMYRDPRQAQIDSGSSYASFWSGHTAAPVAAAVSFAYVFARRRPDSPWRFVAWSVGPLVGLASGVLRMAEGEHFPTDIIVGSVFGAGIGILVPWLHE